MLISPVGAAINYNSNTLFMLRKTIVLACSLNNYYNLIFSPRTRYINYNIIQLFCLC